MEFSFSCINCGLSWSSKVLLLIFVGFTPLYVMYSNTFYKKYFYSFENFINNGIKYNSNKVYNRYIK